MTTTSPTMSEAPRKELQILLLEDMPVDAALINHELRRGGLAFRSKRVENSEQFLHALEHHFPDVILSDHGLPQFDGFTALAMARDRCPDVPFIFVTGSLGEELAVETLRSGATDYVLKNRLATNLVPAVRQALREAEERKRRKAAERALQESEERFRRLVEGVKDYAIFMLDREGVVTSWNSGAEWIHGYPTNEVLGQHFGRFYPEEEAATGQAELDLRTAKHEGRQEAEGWRLRKGGQRFWANVVITALRGEQGRLHGFAHVTRDITERRRAENALHESEARKGAILQAAFDAVITMDAQARVQEWNAAAERILGYRREEALGRRMEELVIAPGLRQAYEDKLIDYLVTGVGSLLGRPIELTARRANGGEFPAEITITHVPLEDATLYTCFLRDITARKQAERELHQSEERYRLLVEGVEDYAIYMLDPEGRITTWNTGAQRIDGFTAEEILGQPETRCFPPEELERGRPALLLKAAAAQDRCQDEGWRVRKDGSCYWAAVVYTALRDPEGKLLGFSTIARDMTARKRSEMEIQRLNSELEQRVIDRTAQLQAAYQEMESFSYSVSHDLRAPVRHIQGFVEALQEVAADKLTEEGRGLLATIANSAVQMGRLIDALLEFSRMGRVDLSKEEINLTQLLWTVRKELERDAQGRKIHWKIGSLAHVWGDPALLRLVLVNLLGNALKYTRTRAEARIEIGTTRNHREIVFHIRDNGVGFDMTYADKLFGVFQRLHRPAEFEGTGIGLANVKRIIQRHGGRVWAEGIVDGGAAFFFSLPQPDGVTHEPAPAHSPRG